MAISHNFDDILRRAVATPNPDGFGWSAIQKRALMEIGILRNDGKIIFLCVVPDVLVAGTL